MIFEPVCFLWALILTGSDPLKSRAKISDNTTHLHNRVWHVRKRVGYCTAHGQLIFCLFVFLYCESCFSSLWMGWIEQSSSKWQLTSSLSNIWIVFWRSKRVLQRKSHWENFLWELMKPIKFVQNDKWHHANLLQFICFPWILPQIPCSLESQVVRRRRLILWIIFSIPRSKTVVLLLLTGRQILWAMCLLLSSTEGSRGFEGLYS